MPRTPPTAVVLATVAAGGMLGASARHAADLAWPAGTVPWTTLLVNVTGCLLVGVLMVHVVESGRPHPLLRPFLGVGVLGGYTTFSTYAVQTRGLLAGGHPVLGLGYLFGTLLACLLAVAAGVLVGRSLAHARRTASRRRHAEEVGRR